MLLYLSSFFFLRCHACCCGVRFFGAVHMLSQLTNLRFRLVFRMGGTGR